VLDLARRGARRIDVGKRCGQHSASQAAINALLLREARGGAVVVRLKGGDPFVFGRGGEEMQYLTRAGIGVEVVPGITAACAAASRLGVPLTHREVARGLHLLTGHTQDGDLPQFDWPALACAGGTLAIYMGRETLRGVATHLIEAGMAPDTPSVAMQNATLPGERALRGTLATLPALLETAGFDGPTMVLIGDAVGAASVQRDARAEAAA
jgi:uroporphyrin-III C-methyltransferase